MIRGTKKPLEKSRPMLKADLWASIHNRFDIEVVDAKSGEIKSKAVAHNVICDQLWTKLLQPGAYFQAIHYGSGTGTPSASDTKLFSFYAAINSFKETEFGGDVKTGTKWCRRSVRIEPSEAVGVEISEIGIAYGTSQTNLCTHAMLKDMNGNEITIKKTDTDVINIYATVYVHHSVFDDGSGIIFPYHHLTEAANATAGETRKCDPFFKWLLGVYWTTSGNDDQRITYASVNYGASSPSMRTTNGLDYKKNASVTTTYVPNEKKMVCKLNQIAVDYGNLSSGIMGVIIYAYTNSFRGNDVFYLQSDGDWWPGSTVTGDPIGTGDGATTDFSTKFSFPKNAKVYVDGVLSDATVSCEPLRYNDMGIYFILIEAAHTGFGYSTKRTPFVSLQDIPKSQSTSNDDYVTGSAVFYNPYYSLGIASFKMNSTGRGDYLSIEVSDDLQTWEDLTLPYEASVQVPEAMQHKKFWKLTRIGTDRASNVYVYPYELTAPGLTGKNVHFDTPPAAGAVITADYTTPVIAKDENHVFDLTITLQFGEYTE